MSLIKSISGIRGTIGGKVGDGLTPLDIVKFTSAYATFIRRTTTKASNTIVVGRDARISGKMVNDIVVSTLTGMGFDVVNIGMATTPTTEIAVTGENACGGIIITASHNPKQWNALKLLNENGEFLNDAQGKEVLKIAPTEPLIEKTDFRMVLPYNAYTLIKRLFDATGTEVKKEEFDINITVEGSLPSSSYPDLKSGAEDIGQGKIILEIIH